MNLNLFKQHESFDNTCKYVKNLGDAWEYGVVEVQKNGNKVHVKRGSAQSYEAALTANGMALRGQDKIVGAFA